MKILHLNNQDIAGGAARAAYRLHRAMVANNSIESRYLVHKKSINGDETIISAETKWEKLKTFLRSGGESFYNQFKAKKSTTLFSSAFVPNDLTLKTIKNENPDIVHLHWICGAQINIESLAQINRPLIWTMHDIWPFTGGCHHDSGCTLFETHCANCPLLEKNGEKDLSHWVFNRKKKIYPKLNLKLVAPSNWIASMSQKSFLLKNFSTEVIHNGIDLNIFKPIPRNEARKILNLPQDKHILLFGAASATSDKSKGFDLLLSALMKLSDNIRKNLHFLVFGAYGNKSEKDLLGDKISASFLGYLHDDISLSMAYNAADIMLVPSRHDNLPNTVIESLSCGTPVVAFKVGGIVEMIQHEVNGFLVEKFDTKEFARGIERILELTISLKRDTIRENARKSAELKFSLEKMLLNYQGLYEKVAE